MSDNENSSHGIAGFSPLTKRARGSNLALEPTEHTPEYLLKWLEWMGEKVPAQVADFKRRICTDIRMRDFWSWIGTVNFDQHDWARSSLTVSDNILRCTEIPGKPGDMTPTQREAYFKKVRTHVEALRNLLKGTCFDVFDLEHMDDVSDVELKKPLKEILYSWGAEESEEGHVVAFQVTREGNFKHHFTYPDNALTETLAKVMEWTYWNDNWDRSFWGTSAPILQSRSDRTPIIYFCCTLHRWFEKNGVKIPFPILATVANVALNLRADELVDEDAARKQVRRYQERQAELRKSGKPATWP